MRGKYSPTVIAAYRVDQEWWDNYSGANRLLGTYVAFDSEGYDSYGYNKNEMDRAGNYESDYYVNDGDVDSYEDFNCAYDDALDEWGFDGIKPVKANHPVKTWDSFLQTNIPDDATRTALISEYEQFQAVGYIGSCSLRTLAGAWAKNVGVAIGVTDVMKEIAIDCYKVLAHNSITAQSAITSTQHTQQTSTVWGGFDVQYDNHEVTETLAQLFKREADALAWQESFKKSNYEWRRVVEMTVV